MIAIDYPAKRKNEPVWDEVEIIYWKGDGKWESQRLKLIEACESGIEGGLYKDLVPFLGRRGAGIRLEVWSQQGGVRMKEWLKGKVALVTGASAGIGRTTALAFAREGAKVVVADILIEEGKETVRMIKEGGGEAIFVKADVTQPEEVEALISTTVETYGRLDCAFNNAGIEEQEPVRTADVIEENWDRVINTNLKGVWLCMKYEIPQMLKQGGGAIVNAGSVAGLVAEPNISSYVASKHGVVGLTKAAALEYAKDGIRVNAVCPGCIPTGQVERVTRGDPQEIERLASLHPIGRMGTTEEIAAAVLWLCSDAASFVTGYPLAVDGGFVAQ